MAELTFKKIKGTPPPRPDERRGNHAWPLTLAIRALKVGETIIVEGDEKRLRTVQANMGNAIGRIGWTKENIAHYRSNGSLVIHRKK